MYFNKSITLKRANYKTNKEFYSIVKHYLRRFKNDNDIDIKVNNDISITFTGKGNVCFY